MKTSLIRDRGSHRCGYQFIKAPNLSSESPTGLFAEERSDASTGTTGASAASASEASPSVASEETRGTSESGQDTRQTMDEDDDAERERPVTYFQLHEIAFTTRERVTSDDGQGLYATGTVENIEVWADEKFGDDEDQKRAFLTIVANFVFVLKQHRLIVECQEFLETREGDSILSGGNWRM